MKIAARGIWYKLPNGQKLIPWSTFLFAACFPLIWILFSFLAIGHQEPFLEYLYYGFKKGDPKGLSVARSLYVERWAASLEWVLKNRQPPSNSDVHVMELFLADSSLDTMVSALQKGDPEKGREPGGDRPYFRGYLRESGHSVVRCEVGIRGFGSWHHAPEKPSLRVKVKKSDVSSGRRYHELHRPEGPLALTNWLAEQVALEMGLLVQQTDHVALFFNHRYLGLYDRNFRPGEPLCVALGRLPGTIFKGDITDPSGRIGSDTRSLWTGLEEWKVFGEDSEYARARFALMLQAVKDKNAEELAKLVDADAMAKWSAVMSFVGSAHATRHHNQIYYFDSTHGRFEPILWDANAFGVNLKKDAPVDLLNSPVERLLFQIPEWRAKRASYLYQLANESKVLEIAEAELSRIRPWLEADTALSKVEGSELVVNRLHRYSQSELPALEEEIRDFIKARSAKVLEYLQSVDLFEHEGEVWLRTQVPIKTDSGLLYPAQPIGERPYQFWFKELLTGFVRYPASPPYKHGLTGEMLSTKAAPPQLPGRAQSSSPATSKDAPVSKTLGPGRVELTEDLLVDDLVILPGTEIHLGAGVSVLVKGGLRAQGAQDAPISLEGEGWGCFAMTGPDAKVLDHTHFSGGTLDTLEGIQFKGMVNAYRCSDVTMTNCQIGKNQVSDDAVNFAHSEFVVRDCTWTAANADALDVDMSQGRVEGCQFENSGNDGLDIMSSKVIVSDCSFSGSQDKGASVGERSRVSFTDCKFFQCAIGIQAKDDSRALLNKAQFSDCTTAVSCYQKKWFYNQGGEVLLKDSNVQGDFKIESKSKAYLLNTEGEGARVERVSELPPEWRDL